MRHMTCLSLDWYASVSLWTRPVRCGELLCEPVGWNFHFVPYEIAAALLCPAFPFRCIPDAICCIWSVSQHMLSVCVLLGFLLISATDEYYINKRSFTVHSTTPW